MRKNVFRGRYLISGCMMRSHKCLKARDFVMYLRENNYYRYDENYDINTVYLALSLVQSIRFNVAKGF